MSYYKTLDGKKLDGRLLEMAEEAVKGDGDGRISKADAQMIIGAVRDGGAYTDVEKDTMESFAIISNGQKELMIGSGARFPVGQPRRFNAM